MLGADGEIALQGRKLPELLDDKAFTRTGSWALTGTGISITDGKLVMNNADSVTAVAQMRETVARGPHYVYKLVVDDFKSGSGASITIGGVEIWNEKMGAGVFRKDFIALNTDPLTLSATQLTAIISHVSVQKLPT